MLARALDDRDACPREQFVYVLCGRVYPLIAYIWDIR